MREFCIIFNITLSNRNFRMNVMERVPETLYVNHQKQGVRKMFLLSILDKIQIRNPLEILPQRQQLSKILSIFSNNFSEVFRRKKKSSIRAKVCFGEKASGISFLIIFLVRKVRRMSGISRQDGGRLRLGFLPWSWSKT